MSGTASGSRLPPLLLRLRLPPPPPPEPTAEPLLNDDSAFKVDSNGRDDSEELLVSESEEPLLLTPPTKRKDEAVFVGSSSGTLGEMVPLGDFRDGDSGSGPPPSEATVAEASNFRGCTEG